jgi:outer membrane immunogenic protein
MKEIAAMTALFGTLGAIMRKSILVLAALAFGGSAFAAPPPPPPAYSWTGFYVGGSVGGGEGDKSWIQTATGVLVLEGIPVIETSGGPGQSLGNASISGVLGGLQAGYNYQAGRWVFGAEGTWTLANINGPLSILNLADKPTIGGVGTSSLEWIATAVGRVGVTFDRLLLYAGGGAAWAREKDAASGLYFGDVPFYLSGDATNFGWTTLGGIEYAIDPHWSARLQYNYYEFGSSPLTLEGTATFTPGAAVFPAIFSLPIATEMHFQTFTIGTDYRF